MLASRVSDENGVEKINPGSFGRAFENALDRAQERARVENRELEVAAKNATAARVDALSKTEKERTPAADERLLEAAWRNPSIAGRELIQEVILRGPMPEPDERPEAPDARIALRTPGLDDPDYRTQPEQADWIGKHSQELRDLYERGAEIKGDVLIIPAEEYELPEDRDQPFITSLSYAHQQIQNPDQAGEFHTLARTIAGETADARTEIEVFRYYYERIRRDEAGRAPSGDRAGRAEALNRTLDEMRLLAREMSGLETRESIEIARPVISFEETHEAEREGGIEANGRGIFHDEHHESVADFHHPEIARPDEEAVVSEGREVELAAGSFNTAARKVSLRDEALRLPPGLSFEVKERLVTGALPAIDRLRRELEKPRGHDDVGRNQQAELMSHSAPDQDRILSLNGHSAGKDLQLFNGSHFDSERNSTVGGLPENHERHSWPVDSDRRWHFDSVRDLAEPAPMPMASGNSEHTHDHSFDYDR